jgi:hypothetical protein
MEEKNYTLNLRDLSSYESFIFPDSFKEYSEMAKFLLGRKSMFLLEDNLIEIHKDTPEVKELIDQGNIPIGAITSAFPNRFIREGVHFKNGGAEDEGVWGWFDLWGDYIITQNDELYDLFFTYKLRQTDLLELDNLLNFSLQNYSNNSANFMRFLRLTLRKHGGKLLQPEQTETINEWIAEQDKEAALNGLGDAKTKGRPKRERDDKITCLNQEQTALLIYCLRQTKIILKDEFLNNKEAGRAFSILTGYSADTIRQNLNKSEVARLATIKNIDTLNKALNDLLKFIDDQIKPEG